jgi:hypothetical protein
MDVNWNGRTFGQLTPEERHAVMETAVKKVARDLASPAMAKAIQKLIDTPPEN